MDTKPVKKTVVPACPEAFKAQAIALVLEGSKPKHVIASELGVGLSTLTKRIHRHRQQHEGVMPSSTPSKDSARERILKEENRRLRGENKVLRQGREILKAAAKFFVRESP